MRFEMAKFDGKDKFSPWSKKVRAILVQQNLTKILDEEKFEKNIIEDEKKNMDEMVYSTIFLYHLDGVLRLVHKATTTGEL